MNLTAEQLQENFDRLVELIESEFTGVRREKLLSLYSDWSLRIATAPASTKTSYFNAFPGGYVLHVLDVCKAAALVFDVWANMCGKLDFEWEELAFVALNHDLGKIGSETEDYYVECTEDWMIRKGTKYVLNPQLQYMKVSDRSLMALSNRGIEMTDKEYLGIKLYDGLYDDANKPYFLSYNEDYELKTSLPYIIHQADLISSKAASYKPKKADIKPAAPKAFAKFFK
jgi:hypothetical protein